MHAIAQPCRQRSGWHGTQTQCSYKHWRRVAKGSKTERHNRLPVAAGGDARTVARTDLDPRIGPGTEIGTPHDETRTRSGTRITFAATGTVATAAGTETATTVGRREAMILRRTREKTGHGGRMLLQKTGPTGKRAPVGKTASFPTPRVGEQRSRGRAGPGSTACGASSRATTEDADTGGSRLTYVRAFGGSSCRCYR